jgi:hypothetical protein
VAQGGAPTGACCLPDGNCAILDERSCEDPPPIGNEGFYQGDDTICEDFDCTEFVPGACCFPDIDVCFDAIADDCTSAGGFFMGVLTACVDDDMNGEADICQDLDPDCGEPGMGDCFEINNSPFCEDPFCCDTVCTFDPFCCDEGTWPGRGGPRWDALCADAAFNLCAGGDPFLLCASPLSGPCFEVHSEAGCNQEGCCTSVCSIEPFCCDFQWDPMCVELALSLCRQAGDPGTTANFTQSQGYRFANSYLNEFGAIPEDIAPSLQYDVEGEILPGWEGQGYDLKALWDVGQILVDTGIASANYTRGETIKVGIIEHAAFVPSAVGPDAPYNHEDLAGKVIPEAGQSPLIIPGSENLNGNHGTACLGIVGAIDHDALGLPVEPGTAGVLDPDAAAVDEVGMIGVAPDADLYFFPIVSVEQSGGRLPDAIASALEIFGPGDVLSFSIGPGSCPIGGACSGTLCSDPGTWLLLRLAADLGVTCCVAAGNSCCDLDQCPQAGDFTGADPRADCDAIIVSACTPGRGPGNEHCRLSFSNFCTTCSDEGAVHVSAWGTSVATLGYGTLFNGDGSPNRTYSNDFGGTSAACPQVAGLVACLQGLSKMFHGIPILPGQIRSLVSGNGFPQCGITSETNRPGDGLSPCNGDRSFDQPSNITGRYTSAFGAAEAVLSSNLFAGNPFVDGLTVIRGRLTYGNTNSIKAADRNYLAVQSLFTRRNHSPRFGAPAGRVQYLATGETVDIMVEASLDTPASTIQSINIDSKFGYPGFPVLVFVQLYNWSSGTWEYVAFENVQGPGTADANGDDDLQFTHQALNAARFVGPSLRGNQVAARLYMVSLGGGSDLTGIGGQGGAGDFPALIDLVRITPGDNGFGGINPAPVGGSSSSGSGGGPIGGLP